MAYHDELFEQAAELADKNPTDPKQADLRRAISAAYYGLFHLLISETVVHWSLDSSRAGLARMFEHGIMKRASKKILEEKYFGHDPAVVTKLKSIASVFVQLQDARHAADYDNAREWSYREAWDEIGIAIVAAAEWRSIASEKIAQDYLVSLLIRPRI